MLIEQLCQIGFTENEAKVYIELLKLGSQAVSVVAKKISLNRTTTYSILRTLEEKGIVSSYVNKNIKFFSANDPNTLVGYVDRKCQIFDYYRSQLLVSIPKFRCLNGGCDFKQPIVSYFEGIEGVKSVLYDTLSARDVFRAYLSLGKWFDHGLRNFLLEYKNFRIADKRVKLKAIVPDTADVRAFFNENYDKEDGMTQVLYLPAEMEGKFCENEMRIYNNKVSMVHMDKGSEYGVVIASREIAEMHKMIFDMAWKGFEMHNDVQKF